MMETFEMKSAFSLLGVLGCLLVASAGCAPVTYFIGDGITGQHVVRSEVEVYGDNADLLFLRGSYIPKLSISGDNNNIRLEEGAAVARVDVLGEGNEVTSDQGAPIVRTEIGDANQVSAESLPKE
jgi:hypothetical protein